MERKINILSTIYFLFLILLFLSGSASEPFSTVIYFLSFILPISLALIFTRKDGVEKSKFLTLDHEGFRRTLPIVFPTVSLVIIISYVTSLVIYLISGRTNSVDVGDSYLLALINHALLPAALEEALFRYVPMRLLAGHSRRVTVLISAFFFALVHHDLFTIPYAFIAGVIFMTVDIALDSVIPSLIIHFINNAISVSLIVFNDNEGFAPSLFIIIGLLTLLSLIDVIRGDYYKKKLIYVFGKTKEKITITPPMIMFSVFTLLVSIISLL